MLSATRVFRIVYKTFYLLLYILLLILLLGSPADIIYQSLWVPPKHEYFVIVLSTAYLVTVLIVSFVYSMRLWINRGVLAAIPRSRIPIDKGDVPSSVRKEIISGLSRSASTAFDARPRVLPPSLSAPFGAHGGQYGRGQNESSTGVTSDGGRSGTPQEKQKKRFKFTSLKKTSTVGTEVGVSFPPPKPVWGEIEHNGWGSPLSPDFPTLEYATVTSELANLIEAKAITLAPEVPRSAAAYELGMGPNGQQLGHAHSLGMPDPDAVALLQRRNLGMRDYLASLAELGVLPPSQTAAEFLVAYEHARFSTRPLSARRFRELMQLFAELLRSMVPIDPMLLYVNGHDGHDQDDNSEHRIGRDSDGGAAGRSSDMDIDDDAPAATATPSTFGIPSDSNGNSGMRAHGVSTPRSSSPSMSMRTDSSATTSSSGSGSSNASQIRHRHRRRRQLRHPHAVHAGARASSWQYRTAPTTPKDLRMAPGKSPSARTMATAAALEAAFSSQPSSSSSSPRVGASPDAPSRTNSRNSIPSFAQSRHPYPISQASSGSLRSLASGGSVVVRLRDR
ncbi:hypothetical protein PpBr36_04351 [Pyricularia pennisetigena]|uniref:hypothetical protein n=1 Tax=Pyricularia pennisetigena TaxID=1578925 RepID=UPI001150A029|nr:hypothetical protein PpBr36_04351 [Pyricularia pennisetigena]TLS27570.1 hypothetical protein PpBr36_04351 [Pyricularia pennisetigena]